MEDSPSCDCLQRIVARLVELGQLGLVAAFAVWSELAGQALLSAARIVGRGPQQLAHRLPVELPAGSDRRRQDREAREGRLEHVVLAPAGDAAQRLNGLGDGEDVVLDAIPLVARGSHMLLGALEVDRHAGVAQRRVARARQAVEAQRAIARHDQAAAAEQPHIVDEQLGRRGQRALAVEVGALNARI